MNNSRTERIRYAKRMVRRAKRRKMAGASLSAAITATALLGISLKTKAESEAGYYTVQQGDNLTKIAKEYATTVSMLMNENKLKSDRLFIGQRLEVPTHLGDLGKDIPGTITSPVTAKTHTVVEGDSLYRIAKKYGITIDQLKKTNKLSSDRILIGDKLIISISEPPLSKDIQHGAKFYDVVAGDTLYGLSSRFGVKIDKLKGQNGLLSERILIGQKLLVAEDVTVSRATIVGAADKFTVEFETVSGPIALKVAYGTAESFQKKSGQKVVISHRNGSLIAVQVEKKSS